MLVPIEKSGTCSTQGPVKSVGDLVVDECLQIGVVPFASLPGQKVGGSDPAAVFRAELNRVPAFNDADVVQDLIIVLGVALRRVPLWTNIQTQYIHFGVRKVGKLPGHGESLHKP